jgi:hypothetical protein
MPLVLVGFWNSYNPLRWRPKPWSFLILIILFFHKSQGSSKYNISSQIRDVPDPQYLIFFVPLKSAYAKFSLGLKFSKLSQHCFQRVPLSITIPRCLGGASSMNTSPGRSSTWPLNKTSSWQWVKCNPLFDIAFLIQTRSNTALIQISGFLHKPEEMPGQTPSESAKTTLLSTCGPWTMSDSTMTRQK